MQRQTRVLGERVEPFLEEFSVHLAQLGAREVHLPNQVRPRGHVDGAARQRLVHRDQRMAETANAGAVAQRLGDARPDGDGRVFGRVMKIDVNVTLGAHLEVDGRVLGKALKHMVQKADPGLDVVRSRAVELEADLDLGFARLALDGGTAHFKAFAKSGSTSYSRWPSYSRLPFKEMK